MARRYYRYAAEVPNKPTRGIWTAALIIGGLGILARFVPMDALSAYNWWLLLIGYVLLVVGTTSRGV
jgi:hypothetical protein